MGPMKGELHSTIIRNTDVKGIHGEIRRSWDPEISPSLGCLGGARTLYESFRHGAELNPMGPCMGFRAVSTSGMATPFIYSSYSECLARVNAFAAGLDELHLLESPTADFKCLGLFMKNCMEWVLAEHAAYTIGGVTVPFYDTLDPPTAAFVLHQTQTKTVVCTRNELSKLCQAKQQAKTIDVTYSLDSFTTVLLVDGVTKAAAAMAEEASIRALSYAQVEAVGARRIAEEGHEHSPPSPLDLATFCYTSGTTGLPKGAMISHQNFISTLAGINAVNELMTAHTYDRHLSYLPLAHIYERVVQSNILTSGASVAFYRGDPQYLIEDLQVCRPTILPVVPRVLNKIYDKVRRE